MKNIIIVLLLCISFLQAKDATLEETIQFLQKKLNVSYTDEYNGHSYKVAQSFINNGNCNFTIRRENFGMRAINDSIRKTFSELTRENIFNAKDLDFTKIVYHKKATNLKFNIGTIENKNNVLHKDHWYEPFKKEVCNSKDKEFDIKFINSKECILKIYSDSATIYQVLSPLDDNVPRVQKAMEHLIKICGGKGELF